MIVLIASAADICSACSESSIKHFYLSFIAFSSNNRRGSQIVIYSFHFTFCMTDANILGKNATEFVTLAADRDRSGANLNDTINDTETPSFGTRI